MSQRESTQVNASQHESTRVNKSQHESTRVNKSQQESTSRRVSVSQRGSTLQSVVNVSQRVFLVNTGRTGTTWVCFAPLFMLVNESQGGSTRINGMSNLSQHGIFLSSLPLSLLTSFFSLLYLVKRQLCCYEMSHRGSKPPGNKSMTEYLKDLLLFYSVRPLSFPLLAAPSIYLSFFFFRIL